LMVSLMSTASMIHIISILKEQKYFRCNQNKKTKEMETKVANKVKPANETLATIYSRRAVRRYKINL
jgi:hypothetical protein